MRLEKIQNFLKEKNWKFTYTEYDNVGSIDFTFRDTSYHVWEFFEGEYGVETNVRNGGRHEDFYGDYETELIEMMKKWK